MKKLLFLLSFCIMLNANCNSADECFLNSIRMDLLQADCAKKEKFSCQILELFSLQSVEQIDINSLSSLLENPKNYEKYLNLDALNKACTLGNNVACTASMLYLNKDNKALIDSAMQSLKSIEAQNKTKINIK